MKVTVHSSCFGCSRECKLKLQLFLAAGFCFLVLVNFCQINPEIWNHWLEGSLRFHMYTTSPKFLTCPHQGKCRKVAPGHTSLPSAPGFYLQG